jgi:hypothetical protein
MKGRATYYGVAAITVLAFMAFAYAWSCPPVPSSEFTLPTIVPGRSFYREWPVGTRPDLERLQDRLTALLGPPISADYSDGVYGNVFQKGPYVIEIGGNWSHPDRKWISVERSWWPLW